MNILYLGAESANWVVSLCNEMCKQGHKVTCVVQQVDEYDKDAKIEMHPNLTRINVSFNDFFNPTIMKSKLITTITQSKFDIIFGSHAPVSPVVYDLARTYNLPWGIMLLDIPTDLMIQDRNRMIQWLYWFDIMKYANVMIFNTKIARDEYNKYTHQFFNDKHVIPYATNMPHSFRMSGADIKGDYVVSVCRIHPNKNCKEIAHALSFLEKPLGYIAIGRDNGEVALIKEICEKNNIDFKHFPNVTEEQKYEIIKNSSMMIYPQATKYIGGLSPFEAMFCGKPVLVRNYNVLRDLYQDHAIYYSNGPKNLAEKIAYVHNMKRNKNDLEVSCKHALVTADFTGMANKMLSVIQGVARR